MTGRNDIDPAAFRCRLEKERKTLIADSDSAAEDRAPVELDQQSVGRLSRMGAIQVQAMAAAVEARRRGRLQQIDEALRRLEEDAFGYCVECGEDIPAKRLDIDPAAARCIGCAG